MPIKKVQPGSGGSGKKHVLHLYSDATLGQVGKKIAELATYYPKIGGLYITSGYRGGNDHHGGRSYKGSPTAAVDFGAYDGAGSGDRGQRRMRDFAKWLEDVVPGFKNIVELIHTTPYPTDNGFYVKDGRKRGPAYYGPAVNKAHLNHVHLAMSDKQVTAALKKVKKASPTRGADVNAVENVRMPEAV